MKIDFWVRECFYETYCFCGSRFGNKESYKFIAQTLGKYMAQEEIELVYGGSYSGIMGVISKTVLENNGKVTGIYPNGLLKLNCLEKMLLHLFLQKRSMKERYYYLKREMLSSFSLEV